jgi:hypothetical protein
MRSPVRHEALKFRAEMKGLRRWSSQGLAEVDSRPNLGLEVRLGAAVTT